MSEYQNSLLPGNLPKEMWHAAPSNITSQDQGKIQGKRGILHRFGVVRNGAIPNTLAWLLHRGKALAKQVRSGSIADLLLAGINPLLFESVL